MNKFIVALFCAFMFAVSVNAAVPNEIRYTGRLKSYQTPVNDTVNMTFKLYYEETGGNSVWTSNPVNVAVSSGIFTYVLKPANIDWSKGGIWLELTIGANVLSPREKLMAQPYSFYAVTAENGVPAGTVIAFAGSVAPKGYFPCDGRALSKTDYPELFEAIGTIYGGSGSNFNIPNFQGVFLRGKGSQTLMHPSSSTISTAYKSNDLGKLQGDTIRNISGGLNFASYGPSAPFGVFYLNSVTGGGHSGSGSANNKVSFDASRQVPTDNENRPVNYAVNYCIKY